MGTTLGYGATTSSGGMTTLSTSLGVMSGCMPPLPGLSIWNMPPLEEAVPQESPTILLHWPTAMGTRWPGTARGRQAPVPQASQMAPPFCQPPPLSRGWPATPYQQVVQQPGKSSGLGVTFNSCATKPAPTGGQDTDECGRQGTRG